MAGTELRRAILRLANACDCAVITFEDGRVIIKDSDNQQTFNLADLPLDQYGYVFTGEATFDPPTSPLDENGQGNPYAVFGFGAHMAEIVVDRDLGTVRVLKVTAAHDVGRAINPTLIEGQIEGGVAQGLGMALMEEFFPGKGENLHDYLIPSAGDIPPVESILIEDPSPIGPFGAKGIGEQAVIPTAPAILNAIYHAVGVRIRKIPATPDRVRAAILSCREPSVPDDDAIRCDACPVLCYIKPGRAGACDRYANHDGQLVRLDPHVVLDRALSRGETVVPFLDRAREWDGTLVSGPETFITAIGAGTTYPDYKPAPFIISSEVEGVDMVTVVTEGIFSYCGVKLKIDTDRHLGDEQKIVRAQGEPVGHVTTSEYGSQMLSLGGVRHLTGGSRKEGTVTCDTLLNLCNGKAVELTIDEGATVLVQANKPPVVDGVLEERMRVGCGSATIGMFAKQWFGKVDDVVVVDDHITGVLSEHQAGKLLGIPETGIKMKGRRSTPGRYFQVAEPGTAWGGTNIADPLSILSDFNPKSAWPGLRLLMVSTTGEHYAYFELDENLRPVEKESSWATQRIRRPHQGKLRACACAPSSLWAALADRCAPASPKIPSSSRAQCRTR